MTSRNLTVVTAGLSQPSSTRLLADLLASSAARSLSARGEETAVEVVELREHATALANNLLAGFPAADLKSALDTVLGAEGLIVVTPIFNASYSGLFKMFFDVLERGSLTGQPVLMAATGGTARHSLALEHALRPMFAYLQAMTVPTAVFAASQDWGAGGTTDALASRVDRAAAELAELVLTQKPRRRADPFQDVTSFEALLAG
ncbi:MAG: FMN reductase [Actinomycetota bacterium]|nr:FMN reductase [Actinomycetota bacterium]